MSFYNYELAIDFCANLDSTFNDFTIWYLKFVRLYESNKLFSFEKAIEYLNLDPKFSVV